MLVWAISVLAFVAMFAILDMEEITFVAVEAFAS